jgi:transcriptional regulator with XRE-family HTH domain
MTEKELQKIFSDNIKKFRMRLNLTQRELAQKIGVSTNFVNDLEAKKKWASPATMVKFANIFGIQVYELLKPPETIPDNFNSIVRKFADDIHAALEQACHAYMRNEATQDPEKNNSL